MEISKEEKKEFFVRKEVLENAKSELKKEFEGLDDIIDEIIDLMEPWFLFPDGQVRPTIINLWGMTGVGKTSLVKRLFELIDLKDSLYKFDVGDYASQDNTKLSHSFSEKLKNREKQQIGIIFDEFQLGRTINEDGAELDKSGLRAMWDLLDSGKISILQQSYYGSKVYHLYLKLKDCIDSGKVESKMGVITKNKTYHEKYFKESEEDDDDDVPTKKGKKAKREETKESLFVPLDFLWYIQSTWETRFITQNELEEFLKTMNHNEVIDFLDDTMIRAFKPMEFDYSKSCIFVIGNIDEAYRMAKNFDPDSDADRFYKHSLNITQPQIKGALIKRFRAEQIARLGNSHIIYPAFSSKVYRGLIELELGKFATKVKERFDIDVEFDKTINTIVYKEGVVPTQGARPVFTSITSLIEVYIGKIIKNILEEGKEVSGVKWKYVRGKHKIGFYNKKGELVMTKLFPVRLKVEHLRKTVGNEMQAHVAIHEAGHAVASIYGAQILPIEILSRTANMSEGYCAVDLPSIDTKDLLIKDIIVTLGGFVAEKMIFGEDNVGTGTGGDFERATTIALNMAKSFGMLDDVPMFYGHESNNTNTHFNTENVKATERAARQLIRECEVKCVDILEENKYLLLKIGEYLSMHSRMDSKKILKFVEQYGKPVEFRDRNNYHTFKQKIADGIKKSQPDDARILVNGKSSGDTGNTAVLESKNKNDEQNN
jgi:cell division protease FtsH